MTTNDLSPDELAAILDGLALDDRALWDALGDAKPSWTTWPTPGAPHELAQIDATARVLGQPLMPWQRWWARLSSERRADAPARYRWPTEVVSVPRQSGKTTGVRTMLTQRGLTNHRRVSCYTAQTGKDARARWEDLLSQVSESALAPRLHKRGTTGSECATWLDTGSVLRPFAPTSESLHGWTPHDVVIDEGFSFTMQEGVDLIGACKPAQATLPGKKLVLISTMGDRRAEWWASQVKAGRAATIDPASRTMYLEWSLPADADPYDQSAWGFHPALGHTIELEDLADAASSDAVPYSEWVRAYCNRTDDSDSTVLDMGKWDAATTPLERLKMSRCAVGYQMTPDRSRFSAVAAWRTGDGKIAIRTVISHASPEKAVHDVVRLHARGPLALAADDSGATRVLTADAARRISALPTAEYGREPVTQLKTREYAAASIGLKAALDDGLIVHGDDEELTEAARGALSRRVGEWWVLSHASPAPIVAAAVAVHALQSQPAQAPMPQLVFATD